MDIPSPLSVTLLGSTRLDPTLILRSLPHISDLLGRPRRIKRADTGLRRLALRQRRALPLRDRLRRVLLPISRKRRDYRRENKRPTLGMYQALLVDIKLRTRYPDELRSRFQVWRRRVPFWIWLKALHVSINDLAVTGEIKAEDIREVAGYERLDGWDCSGHLFH